MEVSKSIDEKLEKIKIIKNDLEDSLKKKGVEPDGKLESIPKEIDGFDCAERYFSSKVSGSSFNINSAIKKLPVSTLDVKDWGTLSEAFKDLDIVECPRLINVDLLTGDKSDDASKMFYNCVNLKRVPEFDTSKIKKFGAYAYNNSQSGGMFYGCSSLATAPNLNTSNGVDFRGMFYGCSSLTTVPELIIQDDADTSHMFAGCRSLVEIPKLCTSKPRTFNCHTQGMFEGCTGLTEVSNITVATGDGACMFKDCTGLTKISNIKISATGSLNGTFVEMFSGCTNLEEVSDFTAVDAFLGDGGSASSDNSIFKGCTNLKKVSNFIMKGRSHATSLFANHSNLVEVSNFAVENPQNILTSLFEGCANLTKVSFKIGNSLTSSTPAMRMFANCSSLASLPAWDTRNILFGYDENSDAFRGCTKLSHLDTTPIIQSDGTTIDPWIFNQASLYFGDCPLDHESIVHVLKHLEKGSKKITISPITNSYLTPEDLDMATKRGVTIKVREQ